MREKRPMTDTTHAVDAVYRDDLFEFVDAFSFDGDTIAGIRDVHTVTPAAPAACPPTHRNGFVPLGTPNPMSGSRRRPAQDRNAYIFRQA